MRLLFQGILLPLLLASLSGCGRADLPPDVAVHAEKLTSNDSAVRLDAVRALARLEHPETVDALLPALADDDPQVRRWAVWALGRKQDARGVVAIIGALGDPDANVRCAATSALGSVRDAKVIAHVANRLADAHPAVRLAAADQLAYHVPVELLRLEQTRIVPLAMKLLEEKNLALSRGAVRLLGRISGRSYGAGVDWLDTTVARRRAIVDQWKTWYATWRPPAPPDGSP